MEKETQHRKKRGKQVTRRAKSQFWRSQARMVNKNPEKEIDFLLENYDLFRLRLGKFSLSTIMKLL